MQEFWHREKAETTTTKAGVKIVVSKAKSSAGLYGITIDYGGTRISITSSNSGGLTDSDIDDTAMLLAETIVKVAKEGCDLPVGGESS